MIKKKRKYKYGSVVCFGEERSRPYSARLTLGYNEKGQPIYHFLDCFEEELDAHICLREYNNKPCDLYIKKKTYDKIHTFSTLPSKLFVTDTEHKKIDMTVYTFKQVYEEWKKVYFPNMEEKEEEKRTHKKTRGKLSSANAR